MKPLLLARSADRFNTLIRPHISSLYDAAFKLTGSQADAEDVVQDVLVKLFPRIAELEELRDPKPWLHKVLYRQFIDFRRKKLRNPITPNTYSVDSEQDNSGDPLDLLESPATTPEEDLIAQQQTDRVMNALDKLDDDIRALLVFNIMEGYTLDQLTTVFDVPVGTLKSRMHRAKALLKKTLSVEPFPAVDRGDTGDKGL